MKMLGLNPMEQEIVDVTNEIARNGLIFFPEFCEVVLARFRAEDEEAFNENMFKVRYSSGQVFFFLFLTSKNFCFELN